MPPFTVARLGPEDIALVRALNAMFGAAFGEPEDYGGAPRQAMLRCTMIYVALQHYCA